MPGKYEGEDKYKLKEWGQNCVMQALSKVLSTSVFALAKQLVDSGTGGLTMIEEMENGATIKKVLVALHFTPLREGGCSWKDARQLLGAQKNKGRCYAVWWHDGAEDWTNKPVRPGHSDHAFSIYCCQKFLELPPTNSTDFDKGHPKDTEYVSVYIPPANQLVACQPRAGDSRRFQYN